MSGQQCIQCNYGKNQTCSLLRANVERLRREYVERCALSGGCCTIAMHRNEGFGRRTYRVKKSTVATRLLYGTYVESDATDRATFIYCNFLG